MNKKRHSVLHSLMTAISIAVIGACLPAQAGQILDEPDGWNRSNVNVRILDVNGNEIGNVVYPDIDYSMIPPDGAYESDIYDTIFTDDNVANETLMATLVAQNPPVGVPPGVKVLNDAEPSQPENCIMATAVGVTCSSGFQTHKRYKVLMKPNTVDGGTDSVDLVFTVKNNGGVVEGYRVFQKISNWTGQRLTGFRLEVGFGIGGSYQSTSGSAAEPHLTVAVDQYFTDPDKQANFAHSLFGPVEPPNWGDIGAYTGGFFDDQSRAGYRTREVNSATYESVPDTLTDGIFGKYEDVLPEDPVSEAGMAGFAQFGSWLPAVYMPHGVFFDDGNPNTGDPLMAWWGYNTNCSTSAAFVNTGDYCWMYGDTNYYDWIDNLDPALGFVKDALVTDYQPVTLTTFSAWAIDSRYYVNTIHELADLNLNYVVNVGTVDASWPTWDANTLSATFTVRVTPAQDANIARRTAQPGYISTPHMPLAYKSSVGAVRIRPTPEFVPGTDTLTLTVMDADLNVNDMAPDSVDVVVSNLDTSDTENNVTLTETGNGTGVFVGTLPSAIGPADGNDSGTIYAASGETVQVTYVDANPPATLTASTLAVAGVDGTVQFTAPVYPNGDILIQVDDLDRNAPVITVTVVDQSTGESEDVSLFQSLVAGQYVGGLASTSVAGSGDDNGIMSVAAGDVLVVTYIDAVAGDGSVNVARTDQITVAAAPAVSGGGGGGCSTGIGTGANPTMPALLLAILGLGWLRYHRRAMRG
jgi:hypothetical protein